MFFCLFILLSLIQSTTSCQGINGCILCNNHAACIQCDHHHLLHQDVCIYNFNQTQKNKNSFESTNNHNNPQNNPIKISSNLPIRQNSLVSITENGGSLSFSLIFHGVGGDYQEKANNCGYQYQGQCIFCKEGYKLFENKCIKNFRRCISFDAQYRCRKCTSQLVMGLRNVCVDRNCENGSSYSCKRCKNGFNLNQFGICQDKKCIKIINGRCIRCMKNHYINADGLCVQIESKINVSSKTVNTKQVINSVNLKEVNLTTTSTSQEKTTIEKPPTVTTIIKKENQTKSNFTQEKTQITTQTQTTTTTTTSTNNFLNGANRYCSRYYDGRCASCKYDLFIYNGYCVDTKCKLNRLAGQCKQCKEGYSINDEKICQKNIANCQQYTEELKCKYCERGYQLLKDFCVKEVQNCKEYKNQGCKQCQSGYKFENNKCTRGQDPNCIIKDKRRRCVTCRTFFYPLNGFCEAVNPLCKEYNHKNGNCTACYDSYLLINGECQQQIQIVNCVTVKNNICEKCAERYYLFNHICRQVSPHCQTYNESNGDCWSCYEGYTLQNRNCSPQTKINNSIMKSLTSNDDKLSENEQNKIKEQNIRSSSAEQVKQKDPNIVEPIKVSQYFCKKIDVEKNICIDCYNSFYLNNGECSRVNPLCKTYNKTNGNCLSCYDGYILNQKTCQFEGSLSASSLSVQNCKILDESRKNCKECAERYYLQNQQCIQVLPQCKQYNKKHGYCSECYDGYTLKENRCLLLLPSVSVPYCQEYDDAFQCVSCVSGYFINSLKMCQPVSVLCFEYNPKNGHCLSCISGYYLSKTSCIQPALGEDPNCREYDEGGYCKKCKQKYKLKQFFCIQQ